MERSKLFLLAILLLTASVAYAQSVVVSGTIKDNSNSGLIGATVIISDVKDSTNWKGSTTDIDGRFQFTNIAPGDYLIKTSYISFENNEKQIKVLNESVDVGAITLKEATTTLDAVTVTGRVQRAQQMGDTTQFNANAYKTNPDASSEDLISKMPGVTSENGSLKVNGETIQQVLVDGKPFFGDDPNAALKNLPAEVVEKIQVFDRLSEQSQFSGFDDGQTMKTINIVTRPGMNNGQFGRAYVGYGSDERYQAGGNVNFFNGDRRISIVGLTNNINQQNFGTEDLVGVMSGSGGGRGGRGNRGGGGGGGPRGGGGFGGGDAGNFMVGQQGGITRTNSIGINYSDNWGAKTKITGSYFFNQSNNSNRSSLNRDFITSADSLLNYNELSLSESNNYNHRLNARIEYTIDSANSIIISPRLSLQQNHSTSSILGETVIGNGVAESNTRNTTNSDVLGYNFSNSLLYRHRFDKKGRTFSLNLTTDVNNRDSERILNSLNQYYGEPDSVINQRADQLTNNFTVSSNISYTEPIGKNSQLQLSYSPSYRSGITDKETRNFDAGDEGFTSLDTTLSNKFENIYIAHNGGVSYRFNDQKINFSTGLNFQYSTLSGDQTFPTETNLERNFQNVLPQANFNYKFSRETNLRIMYRTSTSAPSVTQLQNVLDNDNPLLLRAGNPDLKQQYSHNLSLRFGNTNTTKATSLFAFVNAQYTQNYIANATFISSSENTVINGISLNRGTQLSMPVNLDGYWSGRSFLTYAMPLTFMKSNLNLNTGFTYNQTPGLINNEKNLANNYNFSQGVGITSNISEKLDFNLSYTANYSIVNNTLQKQSNNNYFTQNTSFKFNWLPWKGLVINTSVNHSLYSGLSQSFNQEFLLWNAGIGYKFLKDQSLEFRASVFDILNQNNSIARNVTETYIEDTQTNILQRYVMFTLTYNLRNFKNS